MKRGKPQKDEFVFSTGDEALSTLGEELRQKYPEMAEKFARLRSRTRWSAAWSIRCTI